MKTIKKASLLFASLALVLGAGLVGNSDTKEVKAEDAIISAGENASTAEVKLSDGTTISAMKAGTSKTMGTLKVAIPQGATKLSFYAVAWNKSSSPTIDILDDKSSNVASLSIKADTGIKNNSPFTLSTSDVSTFLVTTSLSDVTTDTTYTLTSTVRFVVWNATVELGVSKSVKSLESSGKLKKTAYQVGETFDPNGLTITANYDDGTSEDVTSKVTWSEITSGATSVTGSYGGKEIVIEGIQTLEYVLSIVADKTSAQVEDEGKFSYTFKDSDGNDVTAEGVEWKSSNDEVIMVDTNTGEWLAMGLGSATITLNVMDSNTNIYEDSVDFVVKVEPVISVVTIASLMEKTAADNTVVSVKGKVSNIVNTSYGNFDLVDLEDSSKKIYVYGATKDETKLDLTDSGNGYYTGKWYSGQNFKNACVEGDIITMNVVVAIYKNNPQIQGVITNVEKPTESIELSDSSLVIKNGETSQLTATLTGLTGNVSWSSDNTDVADVAEDGTITAKAMGNAKITATLSGVTADCDIAVIENSGEDAENALTVEEAIYVAKTTSTATAKKYFIKGIIAAYTPNSSDVSGYGNISFDISDDGTKNNTFKAFQVNYLDGAIFTSTDQVSVGDEVVLYGAVLTYNSIQETDGKGKAYVYSQVTVADKFVSKVNAFNFCNASAEEIKAMLDEYDALVAKNADVANKEVDETTTLAERMAYMQLIYNKKANANGESTSGVVITSNNSYDKTSLIALFAILGIVTISGYYIIEKKKFSK